MIAIFNDPYRPRNYSQEEVTAALETPTDKRILFIINNWDKLNQDQMAKHLGIGKRHVFRLVKGIVPKKKHIIVKKYIRDGALVFDSQTGIYYQSVPAAAKVFNIPIESLRDNLNGRFKKRLYTRFIKV